MADTLKYTYVRKIYPDKKDKSVCVKMRYFKRDIPKKVVDIIGKPKTVNISLHTNRDADVRRFQPELLKLFAAACKNAMVTKRWQFDASEVLGTQNRKVGNVSRREESNHNIDNANEIGELDNFDDFGTAKLYELTGGVEHLHVYQPNYVYQGIDSLGIDYPLNKYEPTSTNQLVRSHQMRLQKD